jgi:hypothetical protein
MVENIHEVYPTFMKYGEPVFLLKVKYMDTAHYTIKFTEQYLRDENTPETRQDFSYQSPDTFKVFIREAPFAFDWNFLNPSYDLFLNDQKLTTNDRFKNNKIFTITSNHLKIHKTSNVPYLIMFQETIGKP